MTRVALACLVILVTSLAGCASRNEPATGPREAPAAAPVRIGIVREVDVPETVLAVGALRARRESAIAARVTAAVVAVLVREGDAVVAGQPLFRLDDREPAAGATRAEAAVREAGDAVREAERALEALGRATEAAAAEERLARVTRGRLARMFDVGAAAAQARDEAVARAQAAAAELARSRETVSSARARRDAAANRLEQARAEATRVAVGRSDTLLLAPFDGVIATRPVDPGTMATAGTPLAVIEERPLRLECFVSELRADRLHPGDAVAVEIGTEKVAGHLEEISPSADPASHSVLLRIGLPRGAAVRSGTFGRARVRVGTRRALLVPPDAVLERGQLELAFVVDAAGAVRLRLVKRGEPVAGAVEVLSGLEAGERVAIGGLADLVDGARVEARR